MEERMFRGFPVKFIDIPANKEKGFNFPYRIIIPKEINDNPTVIYAGNLPLDFTRECSTMDELIEKSVNDLGSIDPMMGHLSLELGNPMVVPCVPRLHNFRPNFLGLDCLKNEFTLKDDDKRFESDMHLYNNLGDQHNAMIIDAIDYLRNNSINVDDKVIVCGYSEGAKFVSHLSLLHPEVIKAVVAGGTGGVMSMPLEELDGYEFTYPTGIKGLDNFNFDEFKKISFYYYMGGKDKADSAMPNFDAYHYKDKDGNDCVLRDECGNLTPFVDENGKQALKLDENGNYTAKWSLYSDSEVNSINKVLGTVIQDRFRKQEEIYNSFGLKGFYKIYEGYDHRTIFDNKEELFKDVDNFINNIVRIGRKL